MSAAPTGLTFTGLQKTAILLMSLGDSASANLLKHLSEEEVRQVTDALANLPEITEEQAASVLEEFQSETNDPTNRLGGGLDFAKRILVTAFGPEGSQKHLDRLPQKQQSSKGLRKLDPGLLARFVETEHPQTVALVLANLGAAQAAAVLGSMKPEQRSEVMLRLARMDQIAPVVMNKISAVISKKLKTFGELKRESSGGLRAVAEIFNQLNSGLSDEILEHLSELDGALVEAIRQKMFVFEDLMSIDSNGVKELLGRVDRRVLTVALKGASEELRKHLLQGMSQRGAAMLMEDMEALGPVKVSDVEVAQQQVISAVRGLEAEGLINLKGGGGGDEQYIV